MKALLILLPLLGILISCSNIRSKQLVGAEPVNLTELKEKGLNIVGHWVDAEGDIGVISVIDAKKGIVQYGPKKDDGSESIKMWLRQTGDYYFANFEASKKGERAWLLLGGNENQIFAWEPDRDAIRKLIAEGKIKGVNDPERKKEDGPQKLGTPEPGGVIDDPKGEWVTKMMTGEFGVIFEWREPRVLSRLLNPTDKAPESEPEAP